MPQIIDNSVKYGVLFSGFNPSDRILLLNSVGCKYMRDQVILSEFDGSSANLDIDIAARKRILLNCNWSANETAPPEGKEFPTDETEYKDKLNELLDAYGDYIEILVIENEPVNAGYYNLDKPTIADAMQPYLDELSWAIEECHKRNIKVADGATHFQYYLDIISPPITNLGAQRTDYLLNGYIDLDLDFQNFHFNAPSNLSNSSGVITPELFKTIMNYCKERIGKQLITNEYYQSNNNPNLTISMIREFRKGKPSYMIAYSNDPEMLDGNAFPFATDTLALTAIGTAFKNNIIIV